MFRHIHIQYIYVYQNRNAIRNILNAKRIHCDVATKTFLFNCFTCFSIGYFYFCFWLSSAVHRLIDTNVHNNKWSVRQEKIDKLGPVADCIWDSECFSYYFKDCMQSRAHSLTHSLTYSHTERIHGLTITLTCMTNTHNGYIQWLPTDMYSTLIGSDLKFLFYMWIGGF